MTEAPETETISYAIRAVERVKGSGRLIALASVELKIGDVEILLQAVQVRELPSGGMTCISPCFRHPETGAWLPAAVLPAELGRAIADEIFACILSP